MRTRRRPPSHPGSILKLHYLEPSGISVTDLAKDLRLSRKTVSKILNEHGTVTPDVALRLSRAFDTTPELWLNLQKNYDLWHTANETTDWQAIKPILKVGHVIAQRISIFFLKLVRAQESIAGCQNLLDRHCRDGFRIPPLAGGNLKLYIVDLAFDNLADPRERNYFNDLPTSFKLSPEQVDKLIDVGGKLLEQHPEFKKFVSETQILSKQ